MKVGYPLICSLFSILFLISCTNTREVTYFDINQDLVTDINNSNIESPIQKNDLLSITVTSLSAEASQMYNAPNTIGGGSKDAIGGYLVSKEGFIQFPALGSVKAEGLTKSKLQDVLVKELNDRKLLLDPIVTIRNINYKVTVLGEVGKPGVINVPSEKINLLEAIGFAGDMTLFANRNKVLVIREENNQRNFKILNLTSNEIFSSPYFYLAPNDIIYVEPNKTKIASVSPTRQWLPVVFSAISLTAIVIDRIIR